MKLTGHQNSARDDVFAHLIIDAFLADAFAMDILFGSICCSVMSKSELEIL